MKHVTIYTTPTCGYCRSAKEFFSEHNVPYEEVNVVEHPDKLQEMIEKSGQRGVPVIFVGDDMVIGFDKPRLMELLEIKE